MSRYPNPLYNQFAAELNLKSEPQIKQNVEIQTEPKFNMWCDLTPSRQNVVFQWILRWFAHGSLIVVFLRQNCIILQISSNLSLFIYIYIYIYATDMIRDTKKDEI
jgi:hypothetical protein